MIQASKIVTNELLKHSDVTLDWIKEDISNSTGKDLIKKLLDSGRAKFTVIDEEYCLNKLSNFGYAPYWREKLNRLRSLDAIEIKLEILI